MRTTLWIMVVVIGCIFLLNDQITGQEVSNYLILNDINGFIASKNPTAGQGPGILAGAGHFYHDHKDRTYRMSYFNLGTRVGPEIQVTQHAGSDSDKWLLHEMEDSYRDDGMETLGLLTEGAILRKIDGDRVFWIGLGGGSFMWLNNNAVIRVSYRSLQGGKPEPLEVVQAYLQKFPSTIPSALVLDRTHDEQWIKDEMERRLWLCDKWFLQLQVGKTELPDTVQSTVKHLNVFLDYREKYYGINARDERIGLNGYLLNRDGTAIKNKLTQYKTWWSVNKTKSISLP